MMREISWLLRITAVVCVMGVAAGKASQPSSPALVAKNYPKEVHQMFQERLNGRGKTPNLGSWASWSQWSSCSRSCGGGVATQTRECRRRGRGSRRRRSRTDAADNSTLGPGDMKSQCVGVYKRFHICNDQACPVGTKDFRQLQCESFNGKQFMGRVYLWEPFLDAPSRCELNCRAVGFRFYATLNQTVVDGTPCRGDFPGRWVCVSDMCKHVGCDGVVGSNKKMDSCGVCGGSNNTCRLVSGLFTMPQLPEGYNLIAQVPRGACNISISEMKPSRNYLALRKADGQYALNGNWAINWSGDYEAAGTVFSFKRQDTVAGEVITASGPLQEPIDIMVLYQQPNPGIKYEYMLPMSSDAALVGAMIPPVVPSVTRPEALNSVIAPPQLLPGGVGKIPVETPVVKDGTVQDSPDSRSPTFPYGSGVLGTDSRPAVITYHQTAGEARPVIVTHPNHQGAAEEPHKPIGKSKSRKRKFAWKLAGFTECTKTCGGGLSTTMVVCVREHNQITVPERRCGYQEKPHPQTIRCNNKPCPAEWVPGEWGECSVTCGDGVQTRDMMCKQEITPTLTMKVAEGACLKPPSQSRTQACQRPECPTQGPPQEWTRRARWETGQWGQCSVPCGQGKRSRMVKCIGVNNSEQEDCPQNDQPAQEEECNLSPCPNSTAQYPWMYTEWTQQCSEECGTGVQTRRVHCSVDLHCDLGLRPDDTRACSSDKQCSGKWFAGPWGQCSPGCGQGHQTRDVVCVAFIRGQHHVALYMNCPENLKPDTDRVCESNSCAPDWFITEWGQCSRECGTGVQKREVKCLDDKQQLSSGCAEDARPPSRRVCNTHDCSTGSATEKSSSHPLSRIDDDPSLSNGAGDQALPDETLHKGGECVDIYPNCNLVVQARLCKYKYYRTYCCHSCHKF